MKKSLILAALLAAAAVGLSGCASLTQAGNTAYVLKPSAKTPGKYEFSVNDGKEFSKRRIKFSQSPSGAVDVDIIEGASSAFQGQSIAGKALSVLPSFAPQILGPGPATVVPQIEGALAIGPDPAREAVSPPVSYSCTTPATGAVCTPIVPPVALPTGPAPTVCYLTAPPYCPK